MRALLISAALAACATPSSSSPVVAARGPIVIVPGTGCGVATYARLVDALVARGRTAYVVPLTGMGERIEELRADVDADAHARDVAAFLVAHDLHDVTLVGHSYGGMPMTGAVGRAPERIARLVYLDAFVPKDGDSVFTLDPSLRAFIEGRAVDGRVPPFPRGQFLRDPVDQEWFASNATGAPLATFVHPVHVDEAQLARVAKGAVAYTQFSYFRHAAERLAQSGAKMRVVDAGHMGVHTHAAQTADALLAVE